MKNSIKLLKSKKGTTLVEILLSVALLAIIVTPLLGAVTASVRNNAAAKHKTQAIALAERVMGELKARNDIGETNALNTEPTYPFVPYTTNISPDDFEQYYGSLKPYYEIVEAVSGKVAQSTSLPTDKDYTNYNYGIPNDKDFDFEIEINQGIKEKELSNINIYEFDDISGKREKVDSLTDFSVDDFNIELNVYSDNFEFTKVKSTDTTPSAKITGSYTSNSTGVILKVTFNGTHSKEKQLVINTTTDNSSFKVYVINDEEADSGVKFINKGKNTFEINYLHSSDFRFDDKINTLYKINVSIRDSVGEIYKTSSYIKK